MGRAMRRLSHWIAHEQIAPSSGRWLDDVGPATGQVIAEIPAGSAEDVDRAVKAAQACMAGSWSQSTPAERADLCDAIADTLEARRDELAELESLDCGKPISMARNIDIPVSYTHLRAHET